MTEGKGPAGKDGRFFADVLSFGWVLPASIAVGAGLGWLLDRLFGIFPVLTAVMGVLGLVAGLRALLKEAAVISDESAGDPAEKDGEKDRK